MNDGFSGVVEQQEQYKDCLEDHPSGCKWLITMVIVFVP